MTHLINILTILSSALKLSAGLAGALEVVKVEHLPVEEVDLGAIEMNGSKSL